MKLKFFEINSYRSCIKTKFPLHDELTALIGANGAGKSNILNAIVLLKKICRARPPTRDIEPSSRSKCRVAAEIEHHGKVIYLKGNVVYETDEHNYDDVYFSRFQFNFREFDEYSSWVGVPSEFLVYPKLFGVLNESEEDILDEQLFRFRSYGELDSQSYRMLRKNKKVRQFLSSVGALFDGINYYSASQFSDPSRCPVSIELEEGRPLRKSRGRTGHDEFMLDLYKSYKADGSQYKRYLNTIGNDGIGLVDKIQFLEMPMPSSYYEVGAGGKIKQIERNRLLVVPRFTINNTELAPNQLSEGTFKTLALVFYILTDESKLLLIEEPEVCVHHGLLSSIISLIEAKSKEKQIVMSTHSDFVLEHMNPENVLLVRWLSGKGTVAQPLRKSMSKNDYQALRVYLKESGNLGEYWKEGGFENG